MIFEITKSMEDKIKVWDQCVPLDVSGAKLAYTFIPTGLGLVIMVQCDVCKRELLLSEEDKCATYKMNEALRSQ